MYPGRSAAEEKESQTTVFLLSVLWNERLQDLRGGGYCGNVFQYCKVKRALKNASLHRPSSASEGQETSKTSWSMGRKTTPVQTHRVLPFELKCLHTKCLTCLIAKNSTKIQMNSGLKEIRTDLRVAHLLWSMSSPLLIVYVSETGKKNCAKERMAIGLS